jgi:hypothetical protein
MGSTAAQWLKRHAPIPYSRTKKIDTVIKVRLIKSHKAAHEKQMRQKLKSQRNQKTSIHLFIPDSFRNFRTMVKAMSYKFSFIRISTRASTELLSAVP